VTAKVCLRCDWSGAASGDECPRCGTTLFAATREPDPASEPIEDRVGVEVRRSWRSRLLVIAAAVAAVAAFAFVQLRPTVATGVASVAGRDGYLLVPAGGPGEARMWIWDLASGTAVPGPVLGAMPDELVESVTLQDTWIGLTTSTTTGARTAAVLRHLGPTDRPVVVARGDQVAWSASAGYVSTATSRPLGGCRNELVVRTWFVTIDQRERPFSGPVCGALVAFGRDRLLPYVALDDAGRLRIAQVGNDLLSTRLRGRTILSVSNDGDLIVQRPGGPLELWYRPTSPIRVGASRAGPVPDDVLTWSPDASEAYVLGSDHGLHGVYRLIVDPHSRPQEPELVAATNAVTVAATTAGDGTLYLATDGVVRRWHDGSVADVPVPSGAPAPEGPILWISTLPYSASEG